MSVLQFLPDAFLLHDDQVFGHGPGNSAARQPLPLLLQLLDADLLVLHLRHGVAALAVQFGFQASPDVGLDVGRDVDAGGVVALYGRFNRFHSDVTLRAAGTFVAADAEEVQVLAAAAASGFGEAQPTAAAGTEDTPLEVVVVDPLLLPSPVAGAEQGLHAVEEILGDQRLVPTFVLEASEVDVAQVVAVAEDGVDVRPVDRVRRGAPSVGPTAQPFGDQRFVQRGHCPLAAGVGLERPLDQRPALRVDLDCLDLAVFYVAGDVAVADGCPAWCAADLGFAGHALEGFGTVVAAFVLGDGGEDAVHQPADRRVVDVLLGGDEDSSGGADFKQGVGVVTAVAGEAVDLIDDDVLHGPAFFEIAQHAQELRPVVGAGRLAVVHELGHHLRAEFLGFTQPGFALGRDGVALWVEFVFLDLPGGGDAQVQHRFGKRVLCGRTVDLVVHRVSFPA